MAVAVLLEVGEKRREKEKEKEKERERKKESTLHVCRERNKNSLVFNSKQI